MKKLAYLAITFLVVVSCGSSESKGEDVQENSTILEKGSSSGTDVVNAFDESIESKTPIKESPSGTVVIDCSGFVAAIDKLNEEQRKTLLEEDITVLSEEILVLVNLHRVDLGLNKLSPNKTAKLLAVEHNLIQIEEDKIGHDNFKNRFCPLVRIESARRVSENTARKQISAAQVVKEWIESPGHRANIEGVFDEIGIASVRAENGDLYFTQLFIKF